MGARVVIFLIGVMLLGCSSIVDAAIYRCMDNAGHVIFTQNHCAPGQSSERIHMNVIDSRKKPSHAVCKDVRKLANIIFPHIGQTDSILDVYSELGGRQYLSAGITSAVNYVFDFRYNPKAKQSNVVALTYSKCLDGGFGMITKNDLPDWGRIKYAVPKAKTAKGKKIQEAERAKRCRDYGNKVRQLRSQVKNAKNEGSKLQAEDNLEYIKTILKQKCGISTAK